MVCSLYWWFISEESPCVHGGTCINSPGSYSCKCAKGYSGEMCESLINECEPDPCSTNFSHACLDQVNAFMCICKDGKNDFNHSFDESWLQSIW